MQNETLIESLNRKFPTAEFTRLANSGDLAAAATNAGKMGVRGVWSQLRTAAGLGTDWNTFCAEIAAAKKARFAK